MMLKAADNQRTTNPKYVGLEGQASGHLNHTDLMLTALYRSVQQVMPNKESTSGSETRG
jgi:hypothetical protein